jgi:hypothetical protein
MIYNDIFAVATWKNKQLFGFEIENSEVAKTQKSIFDIMWKVAKPFKMI